MKLPVLTPVLAVVALGVAACGDDDKGGPPAETQSTASSATTELAATRRGLESARETYRDGDKTAADEQVSEAYLQHFEHVESALEARDHELTEELEDGIREELRELIKTGTKTEVEQHFETVFDDIVKAEAALR
jgi:hypothetical protein